MTAGRRVIDVELGERGYPVVLTDELPGPLVASHVRGIKGATQVLVVTDSNVGPLYAEGVVTALRSAGLVPMVVEIPAGEASKTLDTWSHILDRALAHQMRRGDVVVALGGGVVGDLAGFAAASLLRGVAVVQVPTTLLAQVDSSVGGKTGLNHASGKNLIGAFWQPRAVVASQRVLETLSPRERRCGLAEAIKHGFVADADLVSWTTDNAAKLIALEAEATAELVARCVRIKAAVVAADERESGHRAVLNLGHTLGHAYERVLGYGTLTHGEAVALGMVIAADLSTALGVAAPGLRSTVKSGLAALGLPNAPYQDELPGIDELLSAAMADKKAIGSDAVRFILLRNSGDPLIQVVPWAHIREALEPRFHSTPRRSK